MQMEIDFPGGSSVAAHFKGHTLLTDQPRADGGGGAGPAPFDLFIASIGTCIGFYALEFCRRREIPTDGLRVVLETERNREVGLNETIRLDVSLPSSFPPKYVKAVLRAMGQCTVERHLRQPPAIEVTARIDS